MIQRVKSREKLSLLSRRGERIPQTTVERSATEKPCLTLGWRPESEVSMVLKILVLEPFRQIVVIGPLLLYLSVCMASSIVFRSLPRRQTYAPGVPIVKTNRQLLKAARENLRSNAKEILLRGYEQVIFCRENSEGFRTSSQGSDLLTMYRLVVSRFTSKLP